jgi:hypothetical protein
MKKKLIVYTVLAAFACLALTGCFGAQSPQATAPPEVSFSNAQALADAVAKAKADTTADDENLKGLDSYYGLQTVPDGMKLGNIKVSSQAVILQYANGPITEDSFDNQVTIGWYRSVTTSTFLNDEAQSLTNMGITSDTITAGGTTYLHVVATMSSAGTAAPGSTASVAPTATSKPTTQVVYWVQGGQAFVGFVPLSYTNDDIGKYCQAQKADIGQ